MSSGHSNPSLLMGDHNTANCYYFGIKQLCDGHPHMLVLVPNASSHVWLIGLVRSGSLACQMWLLLTSASYFSVCCKAIHLIVAVYLCGPYVCRPCMTTQGETITFAQISPIVCSPEQPQHVCLDNQQDCDAEMHLCGPITSCAIILPCHCKQSPKQPSPQTLT